MEANKSKYSCVSASCGKPLFSEVKYCPYCSTKFVSEAIKKQEQAEKEKQDKENAKVKADSVAAAKILAEQQEKIKQEVEQAKKEAE